jgi:uncharacterized membrane protein
MCDVIIGVTITADIIISFGVSSVTCVINIVDIGIGIGAMLYSEIK